MAARRIKGTQQNDDIEDGRGAFKTVEGFRNSYNKICFSNKDFGIDVVCVTEPILSSLKG